MTLTIKAKVLVTGATGMQGGAAVQALLRAGHPVTAFVRDPESAPARALAQQGVTLAIGDMDDTVSLDAASAGQDVVFSMQMPGHDPADPVAEHRHARNIATAAKRAGVSQIIHTSVSATGWRSEHPEVQDTHPVMEAYWHQKEAAGDAIRQVGIKRWTIFKPALYMENFLPPRQDYMFPDLPQGKIVTAASPQAVMALINADDFGAAVAAAVADPDKFHEAEIELAGDALTHTEIADTLSRAVGREVAAAFVSREEQEQRLGAPTADSQIWNDRVGYPAPTPRRALRSDHDNPRTVGNATGLDHPSKLNLASLAERCLQRANAPEIPPPERHTPRPAAAVAPTHTGRGLRTPKPVSTSPNCTRLCNAQRGW